MQLHNTDMVIIFSYIAVTIFIGFYISKSDFQEGTV